MSTFTLVAVRDEDGTLVLLASTDIEESETHAVSITDLVQNSFPFATAVEVVPMGEATQIETANLEQREKITDDLPEKMWCYTYAFIKVSLLESSSSMTAQVYLENKLEPVNA